MEKEIETKTNTNPSSTTTGTSNPSHLDSNVQIEFDIKKLLEEIKTDECNPMTSNAQLKRLINTNFVSPYEVLILNPEATEEEIKKQYRQLSLLVHPDKCSDTKASDAFHGKYILLNNIFSA